MVVLERKGFFLLRSSHMPGSERDRPDFSHTQPEARAGFSGRETRLPSVITSETPLGGAIYPFLTATGRAWSLFAHPLGETLRYPQPETFTMRKPTLRWVNGSTLLDVFVEEMPTEHFLATTGLSLGLENGGYVLSKRLSRLMRPHFVSGFLPAQEVSITYQDDFDER